MREHGSSFTKAGVRLAAVVQAHSEQLPELCGYSRDFVCVPDPKRESHAVLGLEPMSFWKMLTSKLMRRARKQATAKGFSQHWKRTLAKESDWMLLPAAALISPQGQILWAYRGTHLGDLPDLDNLLAVAQEHWDPKQSERRRS